MPAPLAARLGLLLAQVAGCAVLAGVAGCARTPPPGVDPRRPLDARSTPVVALRTPGLRGLDDPTVRGPRLVPASLEEARAWGAEPGGGVRAIVAGLRVVASPGGDVVAASDRLPANPSTVCELPERLGGGFLLGMGAHLWAAKTWLGPAAPLLTMPAAINEVLVGLDRVYLRAVQGPLVAVDPRTGAALDLGPLPPSPRIASIAALDAWRAVAVADLRGVLLTRDAGTSWRPIAVPMEPTRVTARGETFVVAGMDRGRNAAQSWEVTPEGQAAMLPPGAAVEAPRRPAGEPREPGPLGPKPLVTAVEDGWPLADGTALIARDGSLFRVRLADGAIVEQEPDAFALKPARCHPLSLARAADRAAFGFVCGAPRGATAVFRWDAAASRLLEVRRFDEPREVLSSGNGALAVRGRCARDAAGNRPGEGDAADLGNGDAADLGKATREQAWCLMTPDGVWGEMRFAGEDVDRARVVVLSDGRVALVRPPEAGDLSTARLTLTDGVTDDAHATHLPLRAAPASPEVAGALRTGVWMDGFEERRPGVLGGWIDAAGSLLGIEITLDGALQAGEYIGDAGSPIASGRWALGWTASGSGFETTDGGMTWTKEFALPPPIAESRANRPRSCGPIGCVAAGWLRIGWGAPASAPARAEPLPPSRPARRSQNLDLQCEPSSPPAPIDAASPPPDPVAARLRLQAHSPARGLAAAASWGAVSGFRPFGGHPGPAIPAGELGLSADAMHPLDRSIRPRPLARAYVWGPGAGEWDPPGRWQVRWVWPWVRPSPSGSGSEAGAESRASALGPAPWTSLEQVSRFLGNAMIGLPLWSLVPGDDPDHALLIERRAGLVSSVATSPGVVALATLEADRAPVEVKRPSGELLPDLQGAVRSGGRWFVATAQPAGEAAATVVWLVDGGVAREVGRLARSAPELVGPGRLVRWVGGGAVSPASATGVASGGAPQAHPIALLVNGPDADHGGMLWITTFDPETHAFGDPEPLAPADLSDRDVVACRDQDAGWEVEASYPGSVDLRAGAGWTTRLQGTVARFRLSRAAACVDSIFGSADSRGASTEGAIWGAPSLPPPSSSSSPSSPAAPPQVAGRNLPVLPVNVVGERTRAWLRCRLAAPVTAVR